MRLRLLVLTVVLLGWPALGRAAEKKSTSADVFGLDRVWSMHLTIQPKAWEAMQPKGRGWFGGPPAPASAPATDNEKGRGKRGAFGTEYVYVKADLEIDGKTYRNVAVRYKGNSSYMTTQGQLKRPLKIDLNEYVKEQSFHGLKKLTLNNNVMDPSAARETLSYSVYRALGVPAPRTAYVKLTLTVPGKFDRELVGLYTLVEAIDKTFLKDHFGSAKGLMLKPEGVGPLEYLGESWDRYEARYRPKTSGSAKAHRRLIEFVKLVQQADDKAFQKEIGNYLDVDEFLRFLAGTVTVVSMDSFLGLTHNYYLYLDPRTNRFVILPWDFDHSFGGFFMMGTPDSLADLSIRHPHANRNRLIERLLADEKHFAAYKEHLRKVLAKGFTREGMRRDLAAINAAIAPVQAAEKKAAAARKENTRGGFGPIPSAAAPDLEGFVAKRVASIEGQLEGKRKGTEPRGFGFGGPGGFGPPGGRGGFGPGAFLAGPVLEAADTNKDKKVSPEEFVAAARRLFEACDKGKRGSLDEKALAEGINRTMPRPQGPPGFPPGPGAGPGGPPPGPGGFGPRPGGFGGFGMGNLLAAPLLKRADANKKGKVTLEEWTTAARALFKEWDKDKSGALNQQEIADGLNALLPAPRFGPPGGGPGGFGPPGFGPPGGFGPPPGGPGGFGPPPGSPPAGPRSEQPKKEGGR